MTQQPLLPHIGICALVPDEWNAPWQPRHYVLARLARYFHVVWVSPAPEWRGMFHGWKGQSSNDDGLRPPGLVIYEPEFWLPNFYRAKRLARFTFDVRLKHARRLLTGRGCRKIIIYIWRPEFASAMDSIPFDLSCYHIDDEYSFSKVAVPPDPAEMELIARVDQVFIHSPGLLEKKGKINRNTDFLPNGVDYQAYSRAVEEPRDLSRIPRPRIGYTGWIKNQIDWPLLLELAKRHPEWSFVFVGPRSPHPEIFQILEELSRQPNVNFLGGKPLQELSAYPQHFDVCIMPYRASDDYAKYIYPLKLHEYLASGRPVVGSPIRSLKDFSNVIALVQNPDEWSHALASALEPAANSPSAASARQEIARNHDWKQLIHSLAKTLCERLGPEYSEQFSKLSGHRGADLNEAPK
jgi:glycosyltransferase involved in cell wall biosynthesis